MTYKEFVHGYGIGKRRIKVFIPTYDGEPTQYEIGTLGDLTGEEIIDIQSTYMIDFIIDDDYPDQNDDGFREASLDQIEWLEK